VLSTDQPTLLAIDTATEVCSIALLHAGHLTQRTECVGQSHSSVVLPWIEALLRARSLTLSDCDAVVFGAGPGSFTGLRIACGVAQGLAWGADKKVVPVGNLAAMAYLAALELEVSSLQRIACAIDARMNEAYWAIFDVIGQQVTPVSQPMLSAASTLAQDIAAYQPTVVAGNAVSVFETAWPEYDSEAGFKRMPHIRAHAEAMARLAVHEWSNGRALRPEQAKPLYVRDRVALTIEERRKARQGT